MIVDPSAIVSIITREDDAPVFARALAVAHTKSISASTLLEASIVLLRKAETASAFGDIDDLIARATVAVEPTTLADALTAREAFARYGKGRHPASLNFGDCFTYALARRLNRPVLCKGAGFGRTDVPVVPLA